MKVLMVSTDRKIFDDASGVRQRVLEYGSLAEELHVIVFSKKSLGFSKQKISNNVWAYPTSSINRWLYIFDAIRISRKIISATGDWLVTTQDPFETGIAGWRVARAKKSNAKLQIQIHTDFLSPYFVKGSLLNRMRVRIAKHILPKADCVRVVSERIKVSIKNSGLTLKSDPFVLPIFVDSDNIKNEYAGVDLHTKYPQFKIIVLMVSRLEKEKNISLALSVFEEVVKRYPSAGLVVVGSGSEYEALNIKVIERKLSKNVVFEDDGVNVIHFYKTADIFLHTSDYEGYGLVFLEAALSGCTVVSTNVGVASLLFKDGKSAYLCDVSDSDCLSKKIITLIENKDMREHFSAKAREDVNNFIKEKTKDEYLARYKLLWEKCTRR